MPDPKDVIAKAVRHAQEAALTDPEDIASLILVNLEWTGLRVRPIVEPAVR